MAVVGFYFAVPGAGIIRLWRRWWSEYKWKPHQYLCRANRQCDLPDSLACAETPYSHCHLKHHHHADGQPEGNRAADGLQPWQWSGYRLDIHGIADRHDPGECHCCSAAWVKSNAESSCPGNRHPDDNHYSRTNDADYSLPEQHYPDSSNQP